MWVGVEVTLADQPGYKKLKLQPKKMFELKSILLDELAHIQQNEDELKKYLAGQTKVYRYNNRLNYVMPEANLAKTKFILENAELVYKPIDQYQKMLREQHYRSLRKELDTIILNIIYETLKKEPLKPEALRIFKQEDRFVENDLGLINTVESLAHLYKMNQSLITYLREQIITTSQELFE